MSRGRSDGSQKKRLVASLCVVAIFLGFLYVYSGSIFGSQNSGSSALEYGSKSLKRLGSSYLGGDADTDGKQDESSSNFGEDEIVPKSFPVSCFLSLHIRRAHSLFFFTITFQLKSQGFIGLTIYGKNKFSI